MDENLMELVEVLDELDEDLDVLRDHAEGGPLGPRGVEALAALGEYAEDWLLDKELGDRFTEAAASGACPPGLLARGLRELALKRVRYAREAAGAYHGR